MQNILIAADIPPLIATILRPWINRVETATHGMGEIVKADAKSATNSLRRRIVVTPAMEIAIDAAEKASATLTRSLSREDPDDAPPRSPALAALMDLINTLHGAQPSKSTVSLGLGW